MNVRATSLDALLADPSSAADIRRDDAIALLTQLASLQAALLGVVSRAPAPVHREPERPAEDRMLDVTAAASLLGLSPRWLYRHAKTLPFTRRISRRILRFSEAGARRWLASRRT